MKWRWTKGNTAETYGCSEASAAKECRYRYACLTKEGQCYSEGIRSPRSVLLMSRTLIKIWLHVDTHLVLDSHLLALVSSHHASHNTHSHLSPPIPLLFRFISVKNNESKHLQRRLHWCSNTQPADSKTHSGIKAIREGREGLLLSNKIMSAKESVVQSSFAKTVRQIVVKEWPISRH